eukprot:c17583_g1_i2.p3 GENE.c17583_g1_i2~~c17583_g1_i2.p3  ORF type:complete len:127 (-),score=18.92 c17583_g1_i2:1295-1675(-)
MNAIVLCYQPNHKCVSNPARFSKLRTFRRPSNPSRVACARFVCLFWNALQEKPLKETIRKPQANFSHRTIQIAARGSQRTSKRNKFRTQQINKLARSINYIVCVTSVRWCVLERDQAVHLNLLLGL